MPKAVLPSFSLKELYFDMSISSLLQVQTSATGQERYAKSITFNINSVSGHPLSHQQKNFRLATAAAADFSIL
eukprot:486340-Pleurochrysis_carterae.AAC.1